MWLNKYSSSKYSYRAKTVIYWEDLLRLSHIHPQYKCKSHSSSATSKMLFSPVRGACSHTAPCRSSCESLVCPSVKTAEVFPAQGTSSTVKECSEWANRHQNDSSLVRWVWEACRYLQDKHSTVILVGLSWDFLWRTAGGDVALPISLCSWCVQAQQWHQQCLPLWTTRTSRFQTLFASSLLLLPSSISGYSVQCTERKALVLEKVTEICEEKEKAPVTLATFWSAFPWES